MHSDGHRQLHAPAQQKLRGSCAAPFCTCAVQERARKQYATWLDRTFISKAVLTQAYETLSLLEGTSACTEAAISSGTRLRSEDLKDLSYYFNKARCTTCLEELRQQRWSEAVACASLDSREQSCTRQGRLWHAPHACHLDSPVVYMYMYPPHPSARSSAPLRHSQVRLLTLQH